MGTLNSIKIPIASDHFNTFNLPSDHVTTMSFMQVQPVGYQHLIRGSSINLSVVSNVRPAPLAVPTYGRIRQNLRQFFVPYRLVFPQYDAMIQDVIGSNYTRSSLVSSPPTITWEIVVNFFTDALISSAGTAASHDFSYNGNYYNFTLFGKWCYKIWYSLGYELVPSSKDVKFNALALLAFAKIFCDWYTSSQYRDSATFLAVERLFTYNDPQYNLSLTVQNLKDIFMLCNFVNYDSNGYFDFAWDKPVSPSGGNFTQLQFGDPSSPSLNATYVNMVSNGTPQMTQQAATNTGIGTQYLHDALQKLTNYMKRHALSGSVAIDRMLSEAGFVSNYLKEMRSIYVGNQSIDVGIGDIYATADSTDGSTSSKVGDYAGRGFGHGSKVTSFKTDEDGIFITLASILPSGGYYQGYDRCNRRINKDEFYLSSEFDGLAVQAIEKGEVYVSKELSTFGTPADYSAGTFGFTGRYGELKRSISRVSGDIALPRLTAGGNSWHLMRQFDDAYWNNSASNISHDEGFVLGGDGFKYNRIFNYIDNDYDPFYCFLHFDVSVYAPMRSLFDTYDFDSDAKRISMDVGAKVN